jgi:hypothetical protein
MIRLKILTNLFVETLKKCLYGETRSKEKFSGR